MPFNSYSFSDDDRRNKRITTSQTSRPTSNTFSNTSSRPNSNSFVPSYNSNHPNQHPLKQLLTPNNQRSGTCGLADNNNSRNDPPLPRLSPDLGKYYIFTSCLK